jgi:hypothetical protein
MTRDAKVVASNILTAHTRRIAVSVREGRIESGTVRGLFRGLNWDGPLNIEVSEPVAGTMKTNSLLYHLSGRSDEVTDSRLCVEGGLAQTNLTTPDVDRILRIANADRGFDNDLLFLFSNCGMPLSPLIQKFT